MARLLIASMMAAAALAAAPQTANAFIAPFGAALVPANGSTAVGGVLIITNSDDKTMRVQVTYKGLSSPITEAHIHCCTATPGVGTAGVAPLAPILTSFPTTTSGAFDVTYDLLAVSDAWNAVLVPGSDATRLVVGMNLGEMYFDIHTTDYPDGEIRGFLHSVPEPGTWVMLIVGFGAVGVMMRRRRGFPPALG